MATEAYTQCNGGTVTGVTCRETSHRKGNRPTVDCFGRPKPKLQLIPGCSFRVESDPDTWTPDGGKTPSPAMRRERAAILAGLRIVANTRYDRYTAAVISGRSPDSKTAKAVAYIKGLNLLPHRLRDLTVRMFFQSHPEHYLGGSRPEDERHPRYRATNGQVQFAAIIMRIACVSVLAQVPLQSYEDAETLLEYVGAGSLRPAERPAVIARLSRHLADRINGRPFNGGAA